MFGMLVVETIAKIRRAYSIVALAMTLGLAGCQEEEVEEVEEVEVEEVDD